jgi:hypothetical protein
LRSRIDFGSGGMRSQAPACSDDRKEIESVVYEIMGYLENKLK